MKKDIFDRIMELPILRIFNPFYKKYKEILLYLFFGVITTLVSFIIFYLFYNVLHINELISNVISWIAGVITAYITNRTWVFKEHSDKVINEFIKFASGRISTLILDELIIFVFVTLLKYDAMLIKILSAVLVVIGNYFISKIFVFKKS